MDISIRDSFQCLFLPIFHIQFSTGNMLYLCDSLKKKVCVTKKVFLYIFFRHRQKKKFMVQMELELYVEKLLLNYIWFGNIILKLIKARTFEYVDTIFPVNLSNSV
jgi:hypothetical protein